MATDLLASLPARFDRALASGSLLFFPSTVHTHEDSGVEFEIRLCPALQHKPKLPTPHFDPDHDQVLTGKLDPFAPPYIPDLYVGKLEDAENGAAYAILLNKYSVVKEHFLLVTKEHQSQQSPLYPPDLVQTYQLLLAAQKLGRTFFAFYNCGDLSGASQHHKHVQFIPIDDNGPPVEKLARVTKLDQPDRPFSLTALPYANHVVRLPRHVSALSRDELQQTLAGAFLSLLDIGISTIRLDATYPAGNPSYNVLITLEHMHLIPRRQETHVLAETGEELSVNALGFSGRLLVKSEAELEAVKKEGVGNILRGVGLENIQVACPLADPSD